jgi:hypothetical protein
MEYVDYRENLLWVDVRELGTIGGYCEESGFKVFVGRVHHTTLRPIEQFTSFLMGMLAVETGY